MKFQLEDDNKWYVVAPQWEGDKEELEMVLGADTLCDILAQGSREVNVTITTEEQTSYRAVLERMSSLDGGYWYLARIPSTNQVIELWLCHVTEYLLGSFPKKLYLL